MGKGTPKNVIDRRPGGTLAETDERPSGTRPRRCGNREMTGPHTSEAQRAPRTPGAFGNEPDLPIVTNSAGKKVIDKNHPDIRAERAWTSLRKKIQHGPAVRV